MSCDQELDLDRLARDSLHFRRRLVELAPGEEAFVDAHPWPETIVFLETGEVEVECWAGECRRFGPGAVLCFGPPLRVLRNRGSESARLIVISRRTPRVTG
jgi:quercetin dioxygenase-like cupin family protein